MKSIPAGRAATPTPCVGREAELEILDRLLEETRAGSTTFVVVEGEAGMGKSRLLEEILALPAASGFSLHRARAEELQPRPFGLLADALGIDARSADPDRSAIADLLDSGSDTAGEATDRRFRVTEGVINLIERAAIGGPVLAVFDDVHWADPSSLQALHVTCRRLAYLPVLVVLACRPLPRPPELARLLNGVVEAGGRHLPLGPLRDEAVGELAASKLAADPGPVLRGRLQGAAGNPLFVLELLDALTEEGFIKVESDVAEAAPVFEPPPSLRMTILRRLAFLSPESLELLRTASLFGGSFSAAQLSLVTDQPLLDVLSHLDEPTAAGFVRASEEAFAFRHDVVREALYLEIPAAVRKGLHLHVGRALAASGSPPAEVAPHLALGAEPGDREAVNWLAQAARQLRWQAPGLAVQLLERAAALLPEPGPEWISLVGEEISTLTLAGRVREADALVDDALSRVSDESTALHLSMARLDLLTIQGRPRELEDMVPRLLAARSVPDRLRESILGFSAAARVALGDLEGAQARLAEAEATGNLASGNLAMWRAVRAIISWMQGRWRGAAEEAGQAVAGLREPSSRHVQVQLWLGLFQVGADEFTEARATLERARAEVERLGFLTYMVEQHWQLAALHVAAGQWDDALAELATSLQLSEETGAIGGTVLGAYHSPLIHLQRGNLDGARAAIERIQREPSHDPTTAAGLWVHPLIALMEDGAGRPMVAADIVETWQDQVRKMTALPDYRGVGRALLRICRAQGRTELADRMVTDAAEARRRADGIPSVDGTALLLQGMAEEDPGALLAAVEAFRAAPRPFDRAEACAEAAICLLVPGPGRRGTGAPRRSLRALRRAGGEPAQRRSGPGGAGLRGPPGRQRPADPGHVGLVSADRHRGTGRPPRGRRTHQRRDRRPPLHLPGHGSHPPAQRVPQA